MIIIGFFMAVVSGVGLPGHMILFGRIINNFVFYSAATNITSANITFSEQVQLFATSSNMTCEELVTENPFGLLQYIMNVSGAGSSPVLCDDESEDIFANVLDYICEPDATLRYEIGIFSLYYIGMATGVLISVFLATVFWNASAYRQTRRMRQAFYHSILHQEIGWFDVNEASELSTRLAE